MDLIISIIFWCMSDNDKLGIAAITISAIASIVSLMVYGWAGILEVILLIVNIYIYNTTTKKDSKN